MIYSVLLKKLSTYRKLLIAAQHAKNNCIHRNNDIHELSRLYNAFADGSALESIALMASFVLPILVLQNPHKRSKTKEHIACLERRLKVWHNGDILSLVEEGRSLQRRLPNFHSDRAQHQISRSFASLMFKGKTHAALDLLSNSGKGGLLHLDDKSSDDDPSTTVRDLLVSKHPPGKPA